MKKKKTQNASRIRFTSFRLSNAVALYWRIPTYDIHRIFGNRMMFYRWTLCMFVSNVEHARFILLWTIDLYSNTHMLYMYNITHICLIPNRRISHETKAFNLFLFSGFIVVCLLLMFSNCVWMCCCIERIICLESTSNLYIVTHSSAWAVEQTIGTQTQ